ncbi:MAG: hypothetical protein U0230_28015 [Polyangiales bacterium]
MADISTCPSGLSGRARGMKVGEERVLADRKFPKNGGQITPSMTGTFTEVRAQ